MASADSTATSTSGRAGRSRASHKPTAPIASTPRTPSTRSMNTEATASASGTPRRPSAVARTASLPTLAGRNVPTNVLTKKTWRMAPRPTVARPGRSGSRAPAAPPWPAPAAPPWKGISSHSQRQAINVRSTMTSSTAASSGPGRAAAACCQTSSGRLFQKMNAVSPSATASRRTLPADGRRAGRPGAAGRPDRRAVTSLGGRQRRQRLEMTRRVALHLDGTAEELRVGHDLLHGADVDLARAQARLADRRVEAGAVRQVVGPVIEIAGRRVADVADLLRVLAVEQRAVRVEEQAL